jgi:acyl dehydratase
VTQPDRRYYFEDFTVGRVWEAEGPVLSESEIVEFASRFDPQYFHVDAAAAKGSPFGGLIASGWHTVGICMRLICDAYLLEAASLGSPGVNAVRWTQPVRPGDRLKLRMTVIESKPSRSKPDRGTVLHRWEVFNQRGEPVMTMEGYGMFSRRNG